MSRVINIDDSLEVVPSGYDASNSNYSSVSSSYPISNGYTNSSSTSYAYITCNTGSGAGTYISYTFDVSSIPEEANIDSIEAVAKLRVSSTSYISTAVVQLYSDSTAKGSSVSARTTSATQYTISNTGTWTREEIDNIEIRYTGTRGTSSTTRAAYLYFYGADLTINYSIHGTAYTVTATSSETAVTVDPATQEGMEGETVSVAIHTTDITPYSVTDNDADVTSQLVRKQELESTTVNSVLGNYTLVSGGFNGSGASYFSGIEGNGVDASTTSSNYYSSGSGTIAVFTYDFNFNVPSTATIQRVWCQVNGHAESTSNSNEYMCAQLISGSTELSDEINYKSIGTSNTTITLECDTVPTVSQVNSMKLQCRLGYYGGAINGATCYVTYGVASGDYYYEYTIASINADHVILVSSAGPYIPPEEDPDKVYYPITISSINATTTPSSGTTRVESGTTQVVTIEPTDPTLTLALDNGVDITNQLVHSAGTNEYTVTTQVSGASYGFTLNSSTGYYVSTNNGVSKSASVARINLSLDSDCIITLNYINYAEAGYDYGMFGKLDTEVATDGLTASSDGSSPSDSTSNYEYICSNSSDSTTTVKTLTYQVSAGTHFIDVKYGKDDASDSGNDSLQWKVASIQPTSGGGIYTYTLTNIAKKHSLIFVFGDVDYYFITSSGNNAKLYPDGQVVRLAGQNYSLIVVPNTITDTLTLLDNNVDRTSAVTREQGTNPKTGDTVVNYTYELTNITAAHTIVVKMAGTSTASLYIKINGTWNEFTRAFVKTNGEWVEEADLSIIFSGEENYVKGDE